MTPNDHLSFGATPIMRCALKKNLAGLSFKAIPLTICIVVYSFIWPVGKPTEFFPPSTKEPLQSRSLTMRQFMVVVVVLRKRIIWLFLVGNELNSSYCYHSAFRKISKVGRGRYQRVSKESYFKAGSFLNRRRKMLDVSIHCFYEVGKFLSAIF